MDDIPGYVFNSISDWLTTTDRLLQAHKTVIKRAQAGEVPQMNRASLKCWKHDLKRLKKITKIQNKMV
jgi:hypothetical protein